jgi:colanic acid/amylovoran biosynthesis glycosyltransferase
MSLSSPRRKVLHIHASAILGGTELRAFQIADRLKADFDFAVLFHAQSGRICDAYLDAGIPYWVVKFPRILPALRHIRQFRPDVIHIFGMKTNLLWRPILFSLGYRNLIGHIAGLTNVGTEPGWLRIKLDLWTHYLLKVYVSNSRCVAERLIAFGFRPDKVIVIHNGIEIPASKPSHPGQQPPSILSVGNLRKVKGQRFLIEALTALRDRQFDFAASIVGTGPDAAELEAQTKAAGLSTQVRFLGEMDNAALLRLMREADLFVLLSLSEGVSGAAIEAMAQGLPVVATNVGGMSELITSGQEGFIVPAADSRAAAEPLSQLLADPELRTRMGEAAYKKVQSEFNISQMINAYKGLYA